MKKKGFTLAEVLIVLGIIGVVAALTIPNFVRDYKCKEIGTKLAKFQNTLEKATTEYVITTDRNLRNDTPSLLHDLQDYENFYNLINDAMTYKKQEGENPIEETMPSDLTPQTLGDEYFVMRDDTRVRFVCTGDDAGLSINIPNENKMGRQTNFWAYFDPGVSGLGNNAHSVFIFGITNKGFVLPSATDTCLTAIASNKWTVLPTYYKNGGVCNKTTW